MKTISLEQPQVDRDWLFGQAHDQSLEITLPDGRHFFLCEVEDADAEAAKIVANSQLMSVINQRSDKTYTHEEMLSELGLEITKS